MVLLQCPHCQHKWDFQGKPRGNRHKVRCSNTKCRKWFEMPDEKWKEMRDLGKPKLIFDLERHGIVNHGLDPDNPINSEVEILLRISNPTNENIGISKIVVNSKDKDYPIFVGVEDYENRKIIFSLTLKPQEIKLIRLIEKGKIPILRSNNHILADIEIYDAKSEIMKKIPVTLSIGYRANTD